MGSWPEFQKCCGFVPLKTGTLIIGIFNLTFGLLWITSHVLSIAYALNNEQHLTSDQGSTDVDCIESENNTFDYFFAICTLVIYVGDVILAIFILVGINKPVYLRKVICYMTTLWLLRLLTSLVSASKHADYEAYLNAIGLLISAYFILVVRSNRLELEGRLNDNESSCSSRRRSFNSGSFMTFYNPTFQPPPPNYEEATRSDPTPAYASAILPEDNDRGENTAAVLHVEQRMAHPTANDRAVTHSAEPIKNEVTNDFATYNAEQMNRAGNPQEGSQV